MKKYLVVLLFIVACSDEDVKPKDLKACQEITVKFETLEREISIYRNTPGGDRAVLADMRTQLETLKQQKDLTCN